MKAEIVGYITCMINNQVNYIENIKKFNAASQTFRFHEAFLNDLNDLLDFVEDIPENQQSTDAEITKLKSVITLLVEQNERQIHRIEQLKRDNTMWQNTCNELREKLESLEGAK